MIDIVRVATIVMAGLVLIASWYFSVDPALQMTFVGLFIAALAGRPIVTGVRTVIRLAKRQK